MAERTARVAPRLQLTYEVAILIALLLIAAVVALLAPRFLSTTNLFQVARNFSFVAAVGVGEAMVILTGRGAIDLSVGSLVSLGAVVVTKLLSLQVPIALAIAAGIGVGLAAGIVNGLLVTRLNIAPLVVTLGMLSVAAGLALVITQGFPITRLGPSARTFIWLGAGFVGPVPMPVIYMVLVVLAGWLVTSRTGFGYALFAVGGNQEAANLAGIHVDRIKLAVFAASGAIAAMTGVVLAARLSVGDATLGVGMELNAIAAVVIGGVSLVGGRGSILGIILGAALIGVLQNAMVLLGVSAFWQQVVVGLTIIVAVMLDRLRVALLTRRV